MIYILCDTPPEPQMSALQTFLEKNGYNCEQINSKKLKKLKIHKPNDNAEIECVVDNSHSKFGKKIDEILISYCENGGLLIPIHHAIALAKINNPKWCEFCGVYMHRDKKRPFTWFVVQNGDFELVNINPHHFITQNNVKYDLKVNLNPLIKVKIGDTLKNESLDIPNHENLPALVAKGTELFDKQILIPIKERIFLFGYKYSGGTEDNNEFESANAGWYMSRGKGNLVYFQLGHSISDYTVNYCQIILNSIEFFNKEKYHNINSLKQKRYRKPT